MLNLMYSFYSICSISIWWPTSFGCLGFTLLMLGLFYFYYRILYKRLDLEYQFKLKEENENLLRLEAEKVKELERLESFKNRLYINFTNEFRTPLTVTLGTIRYFEKWAPKLVSDEEDRKIFVAQLHLVEKNAAFLLGQLNQLQDLHELENDSLKINLNNENIIPFLNYSILEFETLAIQRSLHLVFQSNLKRLQMDFDAVLIKKIINNILSNAIKFTKPDGNVLVSVNSFQEGKNEYLQVVIKDSGIGIANEKLPKIFDRFYQVDDTSNSSGKGTGIGLSHSRGLVKLMDGEISVESIQGEGSTFTLSIPIKNELKKHRKPAIEKNLLSYSFIDK